MVSERFRVLAQSIARARKVPEFPIVVLPADIEELPEDRLQSLADTTLPELIEKLTTQ